MKVFNKDKFADSLLNAIIKKVENKRKVITHKQFRSEERSAMTKWQN
jgi:hypothetical protein